MSTRKIYDLSVVVGSYTDKTGTQKNRYQNIGSLMQTDQGGKFLLLDRTFNPAGVPFDASKGNQILVSLFEPKQAVASGSSAPAAGDQGHGTDDIPF